MGVGPSSSCSSFRRKPMAQETDLREYNVPEFSPYLSNWQLYVGCTVEALIEDGGDGPEWKEGQIENVNDSLLEDEAEKRGVFFQIRFPNLRSSPEENEYDFGFHEVLGPHREEHPAEFRQKDFTTAAAEHAQRVWAWLQSRYAEADGAGPDADDPPPPPPPANGHPTSDSDAGSTDPAAEPSANGGSVPSPSANGNSAEAPSANGNSAPAPSDARTPSAYGAGPSERHAVNQVSEPQQHIGAAAGPSATPIKRSRSADLEHQQQAAGLAHQQSSMQPGKRRRTQQQSHQRETHPTAHHVKAEARQRPGYHEAPQEAVLSPHGQSEQQRTDVTGLQVPIADPSHHAQQQFHGRGNTTTAPGIPDDNGGIAGQMDDKGLGTYSRQQGGQNQRSQRGQTAVRGSPEDNGGSDSSSSNDDADDSNPADDAAAIAAAAALERAEQAHRRSERRRKGKRKVHEVEHDSSDGEAEVIEYEGPDLAGDQVGDSQADALGTSSKQQRAGHAAAEQNGNAGSSNHEPGGGRGASDASTHGTGPAGAADAAANGNAQEVVLADGEEAELEDANRDINDHAGKVKSVRVVNFKNHSHFQMNFGRHVTIVHGENGTGKSAIMQALQVCLGASARDTGAAASIKSFIKTGMAEATACVTLWNEGEDAYRPHDFGHTIEIERRITDRSTAFKLKNSQGRTVATGQNEVKELLLHFQIDASNPVVCLTQEDAKKVQDDKHRFDHYLHANQFDEIILNHEVSDDSIKEFRARLHTASIQLQGRKAEAERLKQAVEDLRAVRRWSNSAQHARIWIPWAKVEEVEDAIAEHESMVQNGMARTVERDALQVATEAFDAAQQREQEAEANVRSILPRVEQMQRDIAGLEEARRTVRRLVASSTQDVATAQRSLTEHQQDSQTAAEQVQMYRTELQNNHAEAAARHQRFQETRQAARELVERHDVEFRDAQRTQAEAQALLRNNMQEHAARRAEERTAGEAVRTLNNDLLNLQRQAANPITAFGGQGILHLLERVQEHSARFHRPPIPPIGSLLTLVDDADAGAVEMGLGRVMNDWIIHDHHDLKLLQQLSQGVRGYQPKCHVFSFDLPPHNLNAHRQPPGHLRTLLRAVNIAAHPQRHTIQNILVDLCAAESVVIVDERTEARRILDGQGVAQGTVRNTFTRDARRMIKNGNTITEFPAPFNLRPRLKRNLQGQMDEVRQSIATAQQAVATCQEAVRNVESTRSEIVQAEGRAKQQVRGASDAKSRAQAVLENLDSGGAGADATSTEGLLRDAEQTQRQCEDGVRTNQDRVARKEQARDAARRELSEKEQQLADKVRERSSLQSSGSAIGSAFEQAQATRVAAQQAKARAEAKLQRFQEALENTQRYLAGYTAQLLNLLPEAQQSDTREAALEAKEQLKAELLKDNPGLSQAGLQAHLLSEAVAKRLKNLEQRIATRQNELGGDVDDVEDKHDRCQEAFLRAQIQMKNASGLHAKLKDGLIRRKLKAAVIRSTRAKQLGVLFRNYMASLRGWMGTVEVKYDQRLVHILVSTEPLGGESNRQGRGPRKGSKKGMAKDLKSLSGGERSFVNTCYTVALGDLITTPFHCLDEIDVFMDAHNRRKALEGALTFALKNGKQVILLTPLPVDVLGDLEATLRARPDLPSVPHGFLLVNQMPAARPT
ncbi:hypothetical protein WJX74_006745 [Apatococcus lobatus]|uniref:RecF/RecN/SMC N-terminal domain-containing protein n=1 Tax=Apatococcus lobatus TaxID=904363 RepID=A0AAW1RJK0_9CHLO